MLAVTQRMDSVPVLLDGLDMTAEKVKATKSWAVGI